MNLDIESLLSEAKNWLSSQTKPQYQSSEWYAFGNLASFIAAIELDRSAQSIERAVWILNHHIADQFDWTSDYCKVISEFCNRADRIRRQQE